MSCLVLTTIDGIIITWSKIISNSIWRPLNQTLKKNYFQSQLFMGNWNLQFCYGLNILMNFSIPLISWMCQNDIKVIKYHFAQFQRWKCTVLSQQFQLRSKIQIQISDIRGQNMLVLSIGNDFSNPFQSN